MTSYGKVARSGVMWSYLRRGVYELVSLPTTIILARLLSPEEFGVTAAATFFIQLGARLMRSGFNTALVRAKEVTPAHASSVFAFNLAMSVVVFVVLWASAPFIGAFYSSPRTGEVIPLAAFSFVIAAFGAVPAALMSRDMRFKETATVASAYTIVESGSSVVFALMGFSYWSLIYSQICGTIVRSGVAMYLAGWVPSLRVSREALRELFAFGSGSFAKQLLDFTSKNFDNVVVGRVLGITALGYYDKAYTLMNRVVTRVNSAGPDITFRIFSIIHDDRERFRRAYRKVVLTVTLIGYPLFGALIVTAHGLFVVLLGERWTPAVPAFQLLGLAGILKLLIDYASSGTQAKGWIWSEVSRQMLQLAMIIGGIALCAPYGVTGAAFAVFTSTAVMFVLMQNMLHSATGLRWVDTLAAQVPAAVCMAGMAALMLGLEWAFERFLPGAGALLRLAVQYLTGAVYYAGFLWFAPFRQLRKLVDETLAEYAPKLLRTVRPERAPAGAAQEGD